LKITRQLEQALSGSVATPVLIKVKRDFLGELRQRMLLDFRLFGLEIPKFNMFATVLPNEIVDEVKQLPFVETIYLDREVRVPEIRGAGITFDPIKRFMVKVAEIRARRALTMRKPEWVPTSESRKVLEADRAGAEGIEGQGIKVAIVDTDSSPRYQSHAQLRGRVFGHTVIEEISDKNGHGGHVSTTALGGELTSRLLRLKAWGVAPKALGVGVKVLRGATGMGNTSDVIKGVEYAVNWGAQVINLSLGGPPTKDPAEDPMFPVFQEIKDKVVTCAAIGNEGPDVSTTSAPGSLPNVLSVGAIDVKGNIANFSSRGPTPDGRVKPDVVAPGVNIWSGITLDTYLDYVSDFLGNGFTSISGTSMATPHVTGLIALAAQLFKKELPEVPFNMNLVLKICEQYGQRKDNTYGWGVIKYSWFKQYIEAHK